MPVNVSWCFYHTLQLKGKGNPRGASVPTFRGAKRYPAEEARCALYQPFEPVYFLRKINFAGLLPGLPVFTRYFVCLRDHFHLALLTLTHFFPWWLVERSTGTPGHPQRGDSVFLTRALAPGNCPWSLMAPKGSSRATSLFSPRCTANSAIGGPWPGGFFPP